jgi:N-carbamoyl-L-amino-acid hydrolase
MTRADAIRGLATESHHGRHPPRGAIIATRAPYRAGGTLERENIPVGVVEGIVAIDRYDVVVTGFANHAGTTVMGDRQDALLAASHLTIAVREVVNSEPGRQVGTVGRLEVTPNAPNVIPGLVRLTIELRDLSAEKLKLLAERIRLRAADIAAQTRTAIAFASSTSNKPANVTSNCKKPLNECGRLGLASRRLPTVPDMTRR